MTAFENVRAGGIIAINLREDDEVIAARLVSPEEDLLLVSKGAQAIRFHADDDSLRPMGRDTSGVIGMRFNNGDELLSIAVVQPGLFVLVATAGGYAKRTPIEDYPVQGRGGKGVLTLQYDRRRGTLVGALIVGLDDELYAITSTGGVIRTSAREVRKADPTGVGDAFRAGFMTGLAGGLDLRRCAELGSMLATYVIETVGTQEYHLGQERFLARLADAYGPDSADEIRPVVTCRPG